jgi:hypothetical protein
VVSGFIMIGQCRPDPRAAHQFRSVVPWQSQAHSMIANLTQTATSAIRSS